MKHVIPKYTIVDPTLGFLSFHKFLLSTVTKGGLRKPVQVSTGCPKHAILTFTIFSPIQAEKFLHPDLSLLSMSSKKKRFL